MVGRTGCNLLSYAADHLRHGCNGVCSLPWIAGVGGDARNGQFKPGAALVSHLNLSVCRLCIQNPVLLRDPAGTDGMLHSPHKILFIHGTDYGK